MNYSTQPYQQPQYNPYMQPQSWQQQRIAELNQRLPEYNVPQYPQYQNQPMQPMQQAPQTPVPRTIMVTSIDEVKSQNVLDGSQYLFIDTSDPNKIYARQMDYKTGSAPIKVFECTTPTETPTEGPQPVNEVQELRNQFAALEARYTALEERLNESKCNCAKHDAAEPTSKSNVPATTADAGTGTKSGRNAKSTDSKSAE